MKGSVTQRKFAVLFETWLIYAKPFCFFLLTLFIGFFSFPFSLFQLFSRLLRFFFQKKEDFPYYRKHFFSYFEVILLMVIPYHPPQKRKRKSIIMTSKGPTQVFRCQTERISTLNGFLSSFGLQVIRWEDECECERHESFICHPRTGRVAVSIGIWIIRKILVNHKKELWSLIGEDEALRVPQLNQSILVYVHCFPPPFSAREIPNPWLFGQSSSFSAKISLPTSVPMYQHSIKISITMTTETRKNPTNLESVSISFWSSLFLPP